MPGITERRRRLNLAGLRVGAALTATLVPLFAVLDWFVIRRYFAQLLLVRVFVAIYAVVCFALSYTRFGPRWVSALSVSLFTLAGVCISAMIYLDHGYQSSYYAGLMLVVLASGVCFRWNSLEAGLCYSTVYLTYLVPGVAQYWKLRQETDVFIGNNFFLLATIVIVFVAQRFGMQQLRREHRSNLELLATQSSLEAAYNDLKALDRMKSSFFNNMTHELRTPLAMILAPLESLMEEASVTSNTRSYMHSIRANAQRLLRLINNLLDLARLDEHFIHLNAEETTLTPVLREIVEYARPLAARKSIKLELWIDEPAGTVCVDVEKLERVIVNLVANALKFTDPGGCVSVWTRESPSELLVGVRDNGRGIPKEAQRWIFERFRQADDSTTRLYGGTGIGLALAKELVELQGGSITVESEEGLGSDFVVHLKRGRDHLSPEAFHSSTPKPAVTLTARDSQQWTRLSTERKSFRFLEIDDATERHPIPRNEDQPAQATRILLVEDNVEILTFLSKQLRSEHTVFLAQDGESGLRLARDELPDIIICDYMMPKLDGVELLRELRCDPSTADMPVIMLSAKNMAASRTTARDAGADIYLTKPFSPQELRSAVNQLLRKRGRQVRVVMREQVRSLEVISAGFAHEIHNPLSYLSNAVHVISEKLAELRNAADREHVSLEELRNVVHASQDRIDRMTRVALTGIERIQRVVDLVHNYTRAGMSQDKVPLQFDELVREVCRLVIPPDGREIQMQAELASGGVCVRSVPGQLEQVIRNLLQNAFEAVQDGGHVWTRTRSDGQWLTFEVCDDGPGMTQDVLARVFTPFFTTKGPRKGLGLGLAISHEIVTQLGGEISVESVIKQGTTFTVRVPVYQEAGAEESATSLR